MPRPEDQVPKIVYIAKRSAVGDLEDVASVMTDNRAKASQIDALNAKLLCEKARSSALAGAPIGKKYRVSAADSAVVVLL